MKIKATRGCGILENFLARQRARKANELISGKLRKGCILDIGCGSHPYFLLNTDFSRKHGLDKSLHGESVHGGRSHIAIKKFDMEADQMLPYGDESFDVVTMLAVIEHIEPLKLEQILSDVFRVMKSGGELIVTTPAFWTDGLLSVLAYVNLVSREEIDEHKDTYSHNKLSKLLVTTGFDKKNIEMGYFELFMNIWLKATKGAILENKCK